MGIENAQPWGTLSNGETGQQQEIFMCPPKLPTNSRERQHCGQCIIKGNAQELLGEFMIDGYDCRDGQLPIWQELSCSGRTFTERVLGKETCHLTLRQLDEQGNTLSKMGY